MKGEWCFTNDINNRDGLLRRRLRFNFKSLENLKKLGLTKPIIEAGGAISARNDASQLRILTVRSSASLLLKGKIVNVGVGECRISSTSQEVLSTLVGSCVAVVIHDFKLKMGGLVHVLLPVQKSRGYEVPEGQACKFASTAIPYLIDEMRKRGSIEANMVSALIGGAHMPGLGLKGIDVGRRNVEVVEALLREMKIPVVAKDVGGFCGRRVIYAVSDATIYIKYTK